MREARFTWQKDDVEWDLSGLKKTKVKESTLILVDESFPQHKGRPGKRGGSIPKGAAAAAAKRPTLSGYSTGYWLPPNTAIQHDIKKNEELANRIIADADMEAEVKHIRDKIARGKETTAIYKVDGKYTPERQALHDKIIADTLAQGKPSHHPSFVMTGGVPGSGKSTLLKLAGIKDHVMIDSDAFKKELPDYKGWNASLVQGETNDIVDQVFRKALSSRRNVVFDGTMLRAAKYRPLIVKMKALGYSTSIYYMDTPLSVAMRRALSRYKTDGRFLDPLFIAQNDHRNIGTFHSVKSLVDNYERRDMHHKILEKK